MKGVTSDVAAKAIIRSCREQFPVIVKKADPAVLTAVANELKKTASLSTNTIPNYFARTESGKRTHNLKFHNNTEYKIWSITINIHPKSGGVFKYISQGMSTEPFSIGNTSYAIAPAHTKDGYEFNIDSVDVHID
jgi:hypothetical protein